MHFTVLYFKENTTLEDLGKYYLDTITEDFAEKYLQDEDAGCRYDEELDEWVEDEDYEVPEGHVSAICDWFQVGGRWVDRIKASRGLKGEPSWCNCSEKTPDDCYTVVEVKDIDDEFLQTIEKLFYGIATESEYFEGDYDPDYKEFMTKLKNKELTGVITLIDCHY